MSLGMIFAIVAVLGVTVFAVLQRSGERAEADRKSFTWLVVVAASIWFGLVALAIANFFIGHWLFADDEPRPDPDTLSVPCSTVDADLRARIEANLVGDPAPSIENPTTAAFEIDGEEWRVVVAPLIGLPGGQDDSAVFIVDPSDTIHAYADPDVEGPSAAQTSSSFDTVDLDRDVWEHPLDYARRCPPFIE